MPRYVAFLRAINVGGHTVKMDRLRELFVRMGFSSVETFIASGNVLFHSHADDTGTLERHIAGGLEAALGYPVATFIRTPGELKTIAQHWPFDESERDRPHSYYVAFLGSPPDASAEARLQALSTPVDAFHVDGRELYWLRRDALGESSFSGAVLEKTLGQPATVRNGRTVSKLAARFD